MSGGVKELALLRRVDRGAAAASCAPSEPHGEQSRPSASGGCCGYDGGLGLESAAAASHFQLFVLLLTYDGWRYLLGPPPPHPLWHYSLPSLSQPF